MPVRSGVLPGRWPSGLRRAGMVLLAVGLVAILASCAAGADVAATTVPPDQRAGFWLGVWHGMIIPVAFVVSLFNHHVGVYEIYNNGGWYNFGFLLGISLPFSGGAGAGTKRPSRKQST